MKLTHMKLKRAKPITLPKTQAGFQYRWQGQYVLITPTHHKVWPDEWRHFRSMILNRNGEVISVGLPKFGSPEREYNRAPEADAALRDGQATINMKYDGSLVIRSVVRGRVQWRTRGTFLGTNELQSLEKFVSMRYPVLLDGSILPEASIQFEWVGNNRVILDYENPELYLLGVTDHDDLHVWNDDELREFAKMMALKLMEEPFADDMPQSLDELIRKVNAWDDQEGVVVRWSSGQKLLRVKSAWYTNEHRRRFDLNPRILERVLQKASTLPKYLEKLDIDRQDPLYAYVVDWRDDYLEVDKNARTWQTQLEEVLSQQNGMSKKEFIKWSERLPRTEREAIRSLRNGRGTDAYRILRDAKLKELLQT